MPIIDSPKLVLLPQAVAEIDAQQKPVIFWDTCALLDIVRLPLRMGGKASVLLKKALALKQKIATGEILSYASIYSVKELNDHISRYKGDLIAHSVEVSDSYNALIEVINAVAVVDPPLSTVDLNSYHLEDLLLDAIDEICTHTTFINKNDDFLRMAEYKVTEKIAPARAKGEFKDAYIWETCVRLRKDSTQINTPFIYISSNISDYRAKGSSSKLDAVVESELTSHSFKLVLNIDAAFGILTGAGIVTPIT